MFGLSISDIFIIGVTILPLLLLVASLALIYIYVGYLFLQRIFSYDFHLTHRKAH